MAQMSLQTVKFKSGFQSFVLAIYYWPRLRCFKRIDGMQPLQKYLRINTWPQHIPIHNLLLLEKDRKNE